MMPEAKLLVEDYRNKNHQPFESSYVSISIGLGIIMLLSLIYGLFTKVNSKRGGRGPGFKLFVILVFLFVTICNFIKPFLHMSAHGEFRVDKEKLW